jgi:peptide/nickel transport system substrate-binding protein
LGGWGYSPDYLPTGEALFSAGGSFNLGSYNDPTANRLITESLTSNGSGQFFAYENYLADQIPVLWQPNVNLVLPFEISKDLGGVSPINTLQTLTPESWYWKTPSRS